MTETFKPADADGVLEAISWAVAEECALEIIGTGSKRALGHDVKADHCLALSGLAGIELFEPAELVMTALPGTLLTDIEAALAEQGQFLAFEPPDLGPLLMGVSGGEAAGAGTIGGVFACNLSGPRRMKAGAARDHLLGIEMVTGRGEAIAAGGRVVKNVTGYDICKLLAGSYGTLAAMTQLTFKIMPAPDKTRTVLVFGLDDGAANSAMTTALNSPEEVSGAAHLPAVIAARIPVDYVGNAGAAVTALRIEGPAPSVEQRCASLGELLGPCGAVEELHGHNSSILWREIGGAMPLAGKPGRVIWRLSTAPASGAAVVKQITREIDAEWFYDWAGGLIWLSLDDTHEALVRGALAEAGGHATLIVADSGARGRVPVFEPQPDALAAVTARVKEGFDPNRILNPGRMYADC